MPAARLRYAAPALSALILALSAPAAFASPSSHSSHSSHSSSSSSSGAQPAQTSSASAPAVPAGTSPTASSPASLQATVLATLENQAVAGYNAATGGLWVNWTQAASGAVTGNYNGTGLPDTTTGTSSRHDPATDLRYLHNLLSYAHQHPGNSQIAAQIPLYTAEVKKEFADTHNARGWYYDELVAIGQLSGDAWFASTARNLAASYAAHFNAAVGTIFTVDQRYPSGFYRSDWALQEGAALVQAGVADGQPTWVRDGQAVLAFVRQHAYVPSAGIYLHALTNVVGTGGAPNAVETVAFSGATGGNGASLDPSELGQDAVALLEAGHAAGDPSLLSQGEALLRTLSPAVNTLGLWDGTRLGYYENGKFTGTSTAAPGSFVVETGKKDTDQLALLQAYHLADQLDPSRPFASAESALTGVALSHLYEPGQHGFLYEWRSDWTNVQEGSGSPRISEVWVTSEADGIALEALQSLSS